MNTFANAYKNFGSLIDLCPDPVKPERKRHKIELKYDLRSCDVDSAWAEVTSAIGESYIDLIADKLKIEKSKKINKFRCLYEKDWDITLVISLPQLEREIDFFGKSNCVHANINRELKISHD